MFQTNKWNLNDDYVPFLNNDIKGNKVIITASSIIVLIITLFFLLPVTGLLVVHIKNFC